MPISGSISGVKVLIKGTGVGGLTAALTLIERGACVSLSTPEHGLSTAVSWFAGGMLAPYCERESAEQNVEDNGLQSMQWWSRMLPDLVTHHGTLVVASQRDQSELSRFATRTHGHRIIKASEIATLEPDLGGRFQNALFYESEAHIDPRQALQAIIKRLKDEGVEFLPQNSDESSYDFIIDATGIARLGIDPDLRGVRGEMLLVKTEDVSLRRPVRLLHPRIPLYIVPRNNHVFMIGATMIESDFNGAISARSMMEFLNAAYALHPAFGEAEIIEAGVGVRPSYPDNFPRVQQIGNLITINGFYRHGYLLAPAMAEKAANLIFEGQ